MFILCNQRTNQESFAASKNLRILLLKQKIRTQHTATNKNFHGTRFAQTPVNFYCFLVNTAKFSMPRFSRKPNFFVFDLEYSTFISNFTTANCKNLCTLRYYVIKNYGNIAILYSKKLLKYEFERSRDIQKIGEVFN